MKTKHIAIKLKKEVVVILPEYLQKLESAISNNKYLNSIYAYILFKIYEKLYHEMPYLKPENVFKFRLEECQVLFVAINKILPQLSTASYEHNQLLGLSMSLDKQLQDFNSSFAPKQLQITNCNHKNPDGSSAITDACGLSYCNICGENDYIMA